MWQVRGSAQSWWPSNQPSVRQCVLAQELETIAGISATGNNDATQTAAKMADAFNGFIFLRSQSSFVVGFIDLIKSLTNEGRFAGADDAEYQKLLGLCDNLKNMGQLTLKDMGEQTSTLEKLSNMFASLSAENRLVLRVLNDVQQRDHLIQMLVQQKFTFVRNDKDFAGFSHLINENRQVEIVLVSKCACI